LADEAYRYCVSALSVADEYPAILVQGTGIATLLNFGDRQAAGLDYSCLRDVASFPSIKKKQLADIFPNLQVLEGEALRVKAEAE